MFNNKFDLQKDGTAQDTHMSCIYSDIAMACMMRTQWTTHSFLWRHFHDDVMHFRLTAMKMQIIIWTTSAPLMRQVRFTMKSEN